MSANPLLDRLRARDRSAFTELCVAQRDRLYGIAWSVTRDRQDALDVLQDTLTSAWRSLSTLRDDTALHAWMGQIALNHARMRLRTRRRKPVEPMDDLDALFEADGHRRDDISAWPERPDDALDRARLARRLARLADRLPDDHRELWALADTQHLSMEEIAELTGLQVANVKTRLHRARLQLREWLALELGARP
ncbi:hypothetical protein LBMAG42_05750 [Deltaproteobacteria bacterium]|nr:hypothetical protein LBMAG42_05750 [Deltaproteobacteria bacterium]